MNLMEAGYRLDLRLDYRLHKLGVMSQERLKIEVKLLLSADRKSYVRRRLTKQRMTLSDLEWPFHASRPIAAVAELLVKFSTPSSFCVSFVDYRACVYLTSWRNTKTLASVYFKRQHCDTHERYT